MELRHYLEFCRRRWWLLLSLPVISAVIAFYGSKQLTPVYRASTTVLVNQTQAPGLIQYNDVLTSERLTNTYAELVQREPILLEVKNRLSLDDSLGKLKSKLQVSPIRNTQLLRISVEDTDPAQAASIANATARAFIEDNANQLGSRPGTVSVAEQAAIPSVATRPNIPLNVMLAIFAGLLIGIGAAIALEYLDDTVKTPADLEKLGGLTTLGSVSRFHRGKKDPDSVEVFPTEPSENYRQLRTNVYFSLLEPGPKSILVTSTNPGEGKSTTASSLAVVLAQAGYGVILVDTDFRRPSLHKRFGVSNSFGLTGLLLRGSETPVPALIKTEQKGLWLLPSGPLAANPSEVLMSSRMWAIMKAATSYADYVIFDSPPLLPVTDATILAAHTDATIVVVEAGHTRSEAFLRGQEALAQSNARIIGAVLNKVKRRHGRGYYYDAYYGQPKGSDPSEQTEVIDFRMRPGDSMHPESEARSA